MMFDSDKNNLGGMKVLIVDDVPDNINILTQMLKNRDLDVSFAMNGEKALELVPKMNPDLILLDIMMPGLSGYEVCEQLKKDENYKDIPIIFVTALSEEREVIKGFHVGGVDYITKPFQAKVVLCRVETQLQLIKKKKELIQSEKLAAIGRMASGMAHEILNPLNIISVKSQLLSRKLTDKEEQIKDLLDSIREQTQRVSELIYSLIALSESSGKQQSVNVNELLQQTIKQIKTDERFKDIKTITRFASELPNLEGSPDQLKSVFLNLTNNACEAMPQGGTLTIESVLDGQHKTIRIDCSDTGVGISTEYLERIFEPFITTKKDIYGAGMGLFFSRGIVEQYQGSIMVKSEVGKGTTFSIYLPAT